MSRVPFVCSELFTSIYWYAWSKISFNFFTEALFYWLLTCVYHIYWIIVHWSWNLYSGAIGICKWAISKPDIQIFFPLRFFGGRGCLIHLSITISIYTLSITLDETQFVSGWENVDFPFFKSQFLGFILFWDKISHHNITCIVFSSAYVLSLFSPYTFLTFDGCAESQLFISLNGARKFNGCDE